MTRMAFGVLALVLAALGGGPQPAQAQEMLVRCESEHGRLRRCAAPTRDGVRLVRQLSRAGCWQGDTWGYDRAAIWVSNGCRADFSVGRAVSDRDRRGEVAAAVVIGLIGAAIASSNKPHDRPIQVTRLRCESERERIRYCSVDTRNRRVELVRQYSQAPCRHGFSWGFDRRSIWVDRGCRAEFEVY